MAITDKYRLEDGVTESLDFADFVRQRSAPMLRTAWLLTGGDWALAEDLAQAAFSQVWRRWTRVAAMEAPEAYAQKVMLNTFLSWRRRRWTSEISTERFVVSPVTTGGFAKMDMKWQIGNSGTTKPDDESWATACTAPVDAHGGAAGVGFDTYSAKNNQIGQAAMKAIVPIIKFFPANPADWTTSPLAK